MRFISRIILIAILIIAAVGCYFIFLNPAMANNTRLINEIEGERQNNKNLNILIDEYLLIRNDYDLLNAIYQKYSLELPYDNDTTVLANEIYNLVDYSNIKLDSIIFNEVEIETEGDEKQQPEIGIIEIEMQIEGGFYESLTFINSFEVLPRTMKIKGISIESSTEDHNDLKTFLIAETYYDLNI